MCSKKLDNYAQVGLSKNSGTHGHKEDNSRKEPKAHLRATGTCPKKDLEGKRTAPYSQSRKHPLIRIDSQKEHWC
jgi:hypothetical protein